MTEDGGRWEWAFNILEGLLLGFSLLELLVFPGEEGNGFENVEEVFDELAVIVSEPHKSSYVAEFLEDRPIHNGVYLFGVHL